MGGRAGRGTGDLLEGRTVVKVLVTQVYASVNTHRTGHFKSKRSSHCVNHASTTSVP